MLGLEEPSSTRVRWLQLLGTRAKKQLLYASSKVGNTLANIGPILTVYKMKPDLEWI